MKFISGLADCHLPGLYSFVVSERTSPSVGMRRVFYAGADCRMDLWDGADFRLKPHNHRQDIRLTLLFGEAKNVTIKVGHGKGPHRLWCYRFGSALLNREFSLERMHHEDAGVSEEPITAEGLPLHWSIVHTVVAAPRTAWLVEEFDLAPEGTERLWSVNHNLTLSSAGLYRKMDRFELDGMERLFLERRIA